MITVNYYDGYNWNIRINKQGLNKEIRQKIISIISENIGIGEIKEPSQDWNNGERDNRMKHFNRYVLPLIELDVHLLNINSWYINHPQYGRIDIYPKADKLFFAQSDNKNKWVEGIESNLRKLDILIER